MIFVVFLPPTSHHMTKIPAKFCKEAVRTQDLQDTSGVSTTTPGPCLRTISTEK